jgi:hypothetical protein
MSMLKDQKDLLSLFNAHGVEYVVIGGYAVNAHGVPRLTKDLAIFIRSSQINSERVFAALAEFGAPVAGLSPADFRDHPDSIFQLGIEPSRVDILQGIEGVTFDQAWETRIEFPVDDGMQAQFLSRDNLILNKVSTGRPGDIADAHHLRKVAEEG